MLDFISVWHNILYIFPAEVARRAVESYLKKGEQFFPSLSVVAGLCDDVWRRQIENQQAEDRQTERDTAKMLFHAPLTQFAEGYPRKSVELIRKACNGEIKFNSPEWNKEFKAIYPDCDPRTGERIV